MENYKKAFCHMFECVPVLQEYLQKFVLPAPGDWPTWYYEKKIIAQEQDENSNFLSLIPEQGPFHVFLNVQEDVLKMYHFIMAKVYKDIFGSDLPIKPKPFRIHLLITTVFLGWLKIRPKVLQKFKLCKDIEFACLLHLLDEVIPISFYHYPVTFRSGNLDLYIATMLRLSILFIIWKRHHYDRSTLSMLSDLCYHKLFYPTYYNFKKLWMVLITEKKVEIWHGVLRSHIQKHNTAQEIQRKATTLAASKSNREFQNQFTNQYTRGHSEKDISIVAGKAAEVLLSLVKRIGKNLGKSKQISQDLDTTRKSKSDKFYLHTFDMTVDNKVLPLAYAHTQNQPNVSVICDYEDCQVTDASSEAIRLACFHTIHKSCHSLVGQKCPICMPHLSKIIDDLTASFNEGLLKPTAHSTAHQSSSTNDVDDDDNSLNINSNTDPAYYQSPTWESHVDDELSTFDVAQPQIPITPPSATFNVAQPQIPITPPSGNSVPPPPVNQKVKISRINVGSLVFWFLPAELSQATLFGRQGSNACTFIAMILAKSYVLHRHTLQLNTNTPLDFQWVSMFISSMDRGNHIYDSVTRASGQAPFFSVAEAYPHLRPLLGSINLEEALDLSITCTNPNVPQSSLAFYLPRLNTERSTAAIVIMNGMTVCFVGGNGNLHLMDSHPHSQFGAMIGMSSLDKIEDFLKQIKELLSSNFNLCTLTFVSFL